MSILNISKQQRVKFLVELKNAFRTLRLGRDLLFYTNSSSTEIVHC